MEAGCARMRSFRSGPTLVQPTIVTIESQAVMTLRLRQRMTCMSLCLAETMSFLAAPSNKVTRLGEDDNQCHAPCRSGRALTFVGDGHHVCLAEAVHRNEVDYETFDISAISGVKYVGRKGTIAFDPGASLPHAA